jgi:hypothetical protein
MGTGASTKRRSPAARLKALFEEAWRRARHRRLRYLAAVTTLISIGAFAVFAIDGVPPHGAETARSPARPVPASPARVRDAYMGVSCARPNDIACDRVGLAIWLREPAVRMRASINGRALTMGLPCGAGRTSCATYCRDVAQDQPCGTYFEGFLRPAGMLDGSLKVKPDRGRFHWLGYHRPRGVVRLTVEYRDGTLRSIQLPVSLSAGWG